MSHNELDRHARAVDVMVRDARQEWDDCRETLRVARVTGPESLEVRLEGREKMALSALLAYREVQRDIEALLRERDSVAA